MRYLNGAEHGGKPMEQTKLAEHIGLTATFLNHLLYGRKRPSVDTAVMIEKKTGGTIPVVAWTQEKKPPA
jgi:DNA-binding transcriptional regulator YdaS (Cro superfamily)